MAKKSGLGGNFVNIFDEDLGVFDGENEKTEGVTVMKVCDIEPNRDQPRKYFDKEQLNSLASSILELGIIQPLTVRQIGETYQIVAGERRWRAARIAGLSEVPVRIMELSDKQTAQIALIENLQREDLNPIEEAAGYQQLIEKFDMKQEEVARKVGKARSSIANSLRMLSLPDDVRDFVIKGEISRGHCKVLMSTDNDELISDLANKVVKEGMTIQILEREIQQAENRPKKKKKASKYKFGTSSLVEEARISLENALGKTVRVKEGKNKITLEIDVDDIEDLLTVVNNIAE